MPLVDRHAHLRRRTVPNVLKAIGLSDELARGTIRLTIGEETTKKDADYVIACIRELVGGLREQSPFYEDYQSRFHAVD